MNATQFPPGSRYSHFWSTKKPQECPTWGNGKQQFEGPLRDGHFVYVRATRQDGQGQREGICHASMHTDGAGLDVDIETYVGMSKRAKLNSFRFEEPAARALYAMLHAHFGGGK